MKGLVQRGHLGLGRGVVGSQTQGAGVGGGIVDAGGRADPIDGELAFEKQAVGMGVVVHRAAPAPQTRA